jgi:hypothetical protein
MAHHTKRHQQHDAAVDFEVKKDKAIFFPDSIVHQLPAKSCPEESR